MSQNITDTIERNEQTHLPHEGAGFLWTHKGRVILGERIKKPKDLAKDPTLEVEYMGGKVEGNETPAQTAEPEGDEELGLGKKFLKTN